MLSRLTVRFLTLLVVLSMALAIGCTDDPGETTGETQNDEPRENSPEGPGDPDDPDDPETPEEPPEELDEFSQLLHHDNSCDAGEDTCTRTATVGIEMPLTVRLVTADGAPIQNAMIGFEADPTSGASAADLTSSNVITDSDGVAATTLRTGDEDNPQDAMGTLNVTARVLDDDDVNTVHFSVGISPKNAAAYIIEFSHDGQSEPDHVQPFLLDADISCNEATEQFFSGNGWPSAEWALSVVSVAPDGSINEAIYPQVENNDKFTVIGLAQKEMGNQDIEVAYGCNDDAPPVEHGIDVRVEVPLVDHLPHIEERYDMTHDFNLTGALPESVQLVIDIISTLAESPAEFILGCPEDISGCGDGRMGLIDLIFDVGLLPEDIVEDIEYLRSNQSLYNAAREFLDDLIEEQLGNFLPSWVLDSIEVAGDITDMLQAFTIRGPMFFDEQPTLEFEEGLPVGHFSDEVAHQRWDDIVFKWSRGCEGAADPEACAEVEVGAGDLGTSDIIVGQFNATVTGSNSIHIEQHSLSLHYGSLLIGAIEKVALPNIFDDSVTSISDLLNELISCDGLAGTFSDEDSWLYDSVETMCFQLINQATDAVYDYVEDALVADGEDHFRLGTPADTPCSIQQPDTYTAGAWPGQPLPFIESFGQPDDEVRCTWETEIDFNGNGEVNAEIPGNFDGSLP